MIIDGVCLKERDLFRYLYKMYRKLITLCTRVQREREWQYFITQ